MSGNDSEALIHYTESRMMEGDFATLLCRYGKDGHMHSISRTEERTQHYDLPCQGKYHRHQFIASFCILCLSCIWSSFFSISLFLVLVIPFLEKYDGNKNEKPCKNF